MLAGPVNHSSPVPLSRKPNLTPLRVMTVTMLLPWTVSRAQDLLLRLTGQWSGLIREPEPERALGLLSEEIDPRDGSFLGNFPQAFSHLGVIASGWKIAQARRAEAGRR